MGRWGQGQDGEEKDQDHDKEANQYDEEAKDQANNEETQDHDFVLSCGVYLNLIILA